MVMCINRNIMECKAFMYDISWTPLDVLIETLWNVKRKYFPAIPYTAVRINRNIMECKACYRWWKFKCWVVLIETLWNVKIFAFGYFCHQAFVLIETLWNVKRNRIEPKLFGNFGINRNIMECKVTVKSGFPCLATVLIETLWNVKFGPLMFTVSGLAY